MGERKLCAGFSQNYLLTVYSADGLPESHFGRQFTPIKYPRYKLGSVNPEFYPAFDRIVVLDDAGNIWLMQYGHDVAEEVRVYDVFSAEGFYLKQVFLPARIYAVQNGKIYSLSRTEDGFIVAKRYSYTEQEK